MKLSLNLHLPLVLAELVAPTGLCLHFHYSTDSSGLSAFPTKLPAPWGQGFCYSPEGSQCLMLIAACCKEWTFSVNVFWLLLKRFIETQVLIFDNCSLRCVKQTEKMRERGLESGSLLPHYSIRSDGDWTEMTILRTRTSGLKTGATGVSKGGGRGTTGILLRGVGET